MDMRVLLLTNQYPPHIYGGAGVHVEYLARELARLTPVEVRTFGTEESQNSRTCRYAVFVATVPHLLRLQPGFASPLHALSTCLAFVGQPLEADVVHCHTWYSHFGGILAKILYGLPLVITVHSLSRSAPGNANSSVGAMTCPRGSRKRPWKWRMPLLRCHRVRQPTSPGFSTGAGHHHGDSERH